MIKDFTYSIIPPPNVPASYSQAGEDAILRFLLGDKKVGQISYLDIGTNSPDFGNNTYLFYRSGSTGVCVEADRSLIPNIASIRPRDKILNVGVSIGAATEADFYVFDVKGISTFDKAEADKRAASGHLKLTEIAKVKLVDINSILRDNFVRCPDLLSIDIEGLDLAVLEDARLRALSDCDRLRGDLPLQRRSCSAQGPFDRRIHGDQGLRALR